MGGLLSKSSHINNNRRRNSRRTVKAISNKSMVIDGQQPGPSGYCKQSRSESPTTNTYISSGGHHQSSDSLRSFNSDDDDDEDDIGKSCKRKLSIVSLVSSFGSSSTSIRHGESREVNNCKFSLTDLSKLGATCLELSSGVIDSSSETEQERLFREEQERLEKETQEKRAKTARLKRRYDHLLVQDRV